MTLESEHQALCTAFDQYKIEYDAFIGGNKSAAARARKQLGSMTKSAKVIRAGIMDRKNKMGTKGGAKKSKKKSAK